MTILTELLATVDSLPPDACWPWPGALNNAGYGHGRINGESMPAHRAVYLALVGPIPEGLDIDHACHTADPSCSGGAGCRHRACVNPAHLEPVTASENTRRARSVIRSCPQGHPYDDVNTYIKPNGARDCRRCRADACARYQARKAVTA